MWIKDSSTIAKACDNWDDNGEVAHSEGNSILDTVFRIDSKVKVRKNTSTMAAVASVSPPNRRTNAPWISAAIVVTALVEKTAMRRTLRLFLSAVL